MFNSDGVRGRFRGAYSQRDDRANASVGSGVPQSQKIIPESPRKDQERRKGKGKKTAILLATAGVLVFGFAGLAGFFFWRYNDATANNADNNTQDKTSSIIEKVSELYLLPENEEPTVAEIKDKNKLSDQAFFDNAKNGDILLVYEKAQVALLYRKSDNKLINVGPINTEQPPEGQVSGEQIEE